MLRKEFNLSELSLWCQDLASQLKAKQIVLLTGDLGVGKTQFVQCMVKALGGQSSHSPTFSIINQYEVKKGLVHHIDLYRLEDDQDLESVGFWELFSQEQGLIFIEWADRLKAEEVPLDWSVISIKIEQAQDDRRLFTFERTQEF